MFNPWGKLRSLTSWSLVWAPLPAGEWAFTNHQTRTITMRPGLTQAERRSCLTHELEHVARGLRHTCDEEAVCEQSAARKLIDIHRLAEALAWSLVLDEVADELWVDRDLLDVRLNRLHPSERALLKRRVEQAHGVDAR